MTKGKTIIAWDGEGVTLDNGVHVYNLFANSAGDTIATDDLRSIDTELCLELLLQYPSKKFINIIYGGSYDVNMILKDLTRDQISILWNNGSVHWRHYRITYASRKKFTVKNMQTNITTTLWDVIGFFQCSFVKACEDWLGNTVDLTHIEKMKAQRSNFTQQDFDEIKRYNEAECELLVLLYTMFLDSLAQADIYLTRHDGAGAIAAYLMKQWGIKRHLGSEPLQVYEAAQYAYAGGRIEAPKIGNKIGRIFRHDINSAYPAAALNLPSWEHARWRHHTTDATNKYNYYLAHVEWAFDEAPFYPLFYRLNDGTILYPQVGEGWYWNYEVELLKKFHPGQFTIIETLGVEWGDHQQKIPFDYPFVPILDVYAQRRRFKVQGLRAEYGLKLGMNSLYGKLAQQAGWRPGRSVPAFHQLLWAGMITSITRAKMYDAAMGHPNDVIAFATDAIFSERGIDWITEGSELGQWSVDEFLGMTIAQSGVYWLLTDEGWVSKYRGFDPGCLEREYVLDAWQTSSKVKAQTTRFIGMGSALAMKEEDWSTWRRWLTMPRELDPVPTGKRIPGPNTDYSGGLRSTLPAPNPQEGMSLKHKIVWIDGQFPVKPNVEGVPMDIVEDEWEDSYE